MERIALNLKKIKEEDTEKIFKMIEKFDDDDDVKEVYHNLEIT